MVNGRINLERELKGMGGGGSKGLLVKPHIAKGAIAIAFVVHCATAAVIRPIVNANAPCH